MEAKCPECKSTMLFSPPSREGVRVVVCKTCDYRWIVSSDEESVSALKQQEGGDHYKNMLIQPVEYIHRNGLGFCAGNVVKYVTRYQQKNGIEDLKKARHYIDMLIEMESNDA